MSEVNTPTIEEVVDGSLEGLSGVELIQLAFLAFVHMDKENVIPKEELYKQIIMWFDAMTDDVHRIEPHQYVEPTTGHLQ